MKPLPPDTAFIQQQRLAHYCRTGNYKRLLGTTPNRVQQYRRLVYNVADDTLQTAYPLTYALLTTAEWDALVNDFYSNHRCQSYQVWKMPYELYEYVAGNDLSLKQQYPFLTDLLLFEWMEIELFMMEDKKAGAFLREGELITDVLVCNPEHVLLQLDYPVHTKKAATITSADHGLYYLLLYRLPDTGQVQFIELSAFYAWLVEQVTTTGYPVYEISKEAASLFNIPRQVLLENCVPLLEELQQQQFILGFRSS